MNRRGIVCKCGNWKTGKKDSGKCSERMLLLFLSLTPIKSTMVLSWFHRHEKSGIIVVFRHDHCNIIFIEMPKITMEYKYDNHKPLSKILYHGTTSVLILSGKCQDNPLGCQSLMHTHTHTSRSLPPHHYQVWQGCLPQK